MSITSTASIMYIIYKRLHSHVDFLIETIKSQGEAEETGSKVIHRYDN